MTSGRARTWLFVALLFVARAASAQPLGDAGPPVPPAAKPSAADEASAKRQFENGIKLYAEGAYDGALIAFETSYRLGGRPVALKNVAQAQRSMKHFVDAYEAYEALLARHDAQLSPQDRAAVRQALEELSILSGTLQVNVSVVGAEILLDGKPVARSPMTKPRRVSVAGHLVRVQKDAFEPFETNLNVGSQEQKALEVTLSPEKTTARLIVREQGGRDVRVLIDGEDRGAAPWEGDVAAGGHTIALRSPKFASEPRAVKLVAKERADVALEATPLLGRLRVTTVPATATIRVDGKDVGSGAWEGELAEGNHRVEVAVGSGAPQIREVVVGRGQLVVQEIPVVGAFAQGSVPVYEGFYGRLALQPGFVLTGLADNAVPPTTTHDGAFLFMPTATLRVGRSWGWLGGELVGAFAFEHREESLTVASGGGQRNPRVESNDVSFFVGAGARATSKDDALRFTVGVAPGVAVRNFSAGTRPNGDGGSGGSDGQSFVQTSGSTDQEFARAGYTTFAVTADAGILIGSTPGTKLFLGVHAWIDFPPGDVVVGPDTKNNLGAYVRPGRGVVLVDGPQVVLGPSLGLQFGH